MTIGRLAKAANVGIETIRYYQSRGLLPVPDRNASAGAYRQYESSLIDRIRVIKRSQGLGFSLSEIGLLLALKDGRDRIAIRNIAANRLRDIEAKLQELTRMQGTLRQLVDRCETTQRTSACPIMETLCHDAGSPGV